MKHLSEAEQNSLSNQLIKLGDIIGDGDLSASDQRYYGGQYKKIMKALHPEMYPSKRRKPSQQLVRQLKPCDCGTKGWKFRANASGRSIECSTCTRKSKPCPTNKEAIISWNNTFDSPQLEIPVDNSVNK